ncbi:DUF456 family protein [Aeromicrobium sp. 636]|uniref:DUF456 domain-containing protein n=1 Tax=Aeromicrobium senzhongii TaxID=2663859 RepID=A0A8I0EWI5_9ACTN|nr:MULTISPECIES: DUF456 domain-containing protein [Aeromicrobium]MBC9226617.1 DUF456 domain-containing protein [Aeromicrobium senzhongii]MCQ3998718.1 DUF456 family protein [Aeromicrobium sp. 636]MTB89145.1 DUF456 family protein [Aeromicrobium senzhongii]QNL93587.1 DUF456 domain-containing protein [Aeromicrobium senzhongii]
MSGVVFDLVIALVIVLGLVGAIVQVVPGGFVVGGAVIVWGIVTGGATGWTVAALALVLTLAAMGLKYLLAGRYLQRRGVPNRSLVVGAVLGVVGFFVIPVVGLFVGFAGGTYLSELQRLGDEPAARRATGHALRATGIAILVELTGALLTAGAWLVAVLVVRV